MALQKSEWLPLADILDKPQLYTRGTYFDLVFIDAGRPCLLTPKNHCAYSGPRWYGRELAELIIRGVRNKEGVKITTDHFGMAFTANRHATGKAVEVTYDRMDAFVEAGLLKCGSQGRDTPRASRSS